MRRRRFLALVAGASAARSLPSLAQPAPLPVVGCLFDPNDVSYLAFKRGLAGAGKEEGRDYRIVAATSSAEGWPARVREIVAGGASVIVTLSGTPPVHAALDASATLPVVAILSEDPVAAGVASSLNRPGGRVTGVITLSIQMVAKQLEIINELLPRGRTVGVLVPSNYHAEEFTDEANTSAKRLDRPIIICYADGEAGLEAAVAQARQADAVGIVVPSNPLFFTVHEKLVALAAKYALPAVYAPGDILDRGGLIAYGATFADLLRQLGQLTAKVLAGAKPGELPFEEPTRVVLGINLKVAKELGLTVPGTLLARADQIIE